MFGTSVEHRSRGPRGMIPTGLEARRTVIIVWTCGNGRR
jgi:hypothetical protein